MRSRWWCNGLVAACAGGTRDPLPIAESVGLLQPRPMPEGYGTLPSASAHDMQINSLFDILPCREAGRRRKAVAAVQASACAASLPGIAPAAADRTTPA